MRFWSGSILQLTVFVRGLVCLRSWSGSKSWICRIVASLTRASANPFSTSMAKRPLLAKGCSRGKMAICDLPRPYPPAGDPNAHQTFHRMVETMGSGKDTKSQRYRWFMSMCSFGLWMRHPAMRNYGSEGVLMHQLRKYGAKLEHPPAADADAYTVWCALTAQTAWKDGLLRQMFFEDSLTVLDVQDSAAGHHYWLNIITDITEEEELQWMWKFRVRDVLRDEALSEDGKKAVPFTSAAIIFKAAIRSNTKRAAFVESHGIEGTRRGMFGDQFTEHERKKRRGYSRPKNFHQTKLPLMLLRQSWRQRVSVVPTCMHCVIWQKGTASHAGAMASRSVIMTASQRQSVPSMK